MFIMKFLSSFRRTPISCAYMDTVIKNTLNSDAPMIQYARKLRGQQASGEVLSNRFYSSKPIVSRIKDSSEEAKKQKEGEKKKRDFIQKITLIDPEGNISVLTKREANNLADRRNLKLIFLRDDTKSGRQEYKLVSKTDFLKSNLRGDLQTDSEGKSSSTGFKKEKLAALSSKIGEGDLYAKIKKMHQWIEKNHEVRVVITVEGGESAAGENVFKVIEREMQTKARVLQKVDKGGTIKFVILPPENKKRKDQSKEQKTKKKKPTANPVEENETLESS